VREGGEIGDGEDVVSEEGHEDYEGEGGGEDQDASEDAEFADFLGGSKAAILDVCWRSFGCDCFDEWNGLKRREEEKVRLFEVGRGAVFQRAAQLEVTLPRLIVGMLLHETRGISPAISLVCNAVLLTQGREKKLRQILTFCSCW